MTEQTTESRKSPGIVRTLVVSVFGVLTPVLAVAVEYDSRNWTDIALDPVPTPVHAIAILGVAAVNLTLLVFAHRGREAPAFVRGPAWGAALAVALWYSLVFLPFLPVAVLGILLLAAGLLPLSPFTATGCLWLVRPAKGMRRGAWWGALAALVILSLADLPRVSAHVLITKATRGDVASLQLARSTLATSTVHAAASEKPSFMSPLGAGTNWGWSRDDTKAQRAAWQITGELPPPPIEGSLLDFGDRLTQIERERGGEVVGTRVPGLCLQLLHRSRDVDPIAGVAITRWELTFRNDSRDRAEARALLQLPAGAVVSDASLWVRGEERPAVFAGHEKAREVYESIVEARRDPLLITQRGPDQVLVQCFPVPPKETMRISLTISSRAVESALGTASFAQPYLLERNFELCDDGTFVPGSLGEAVSVAQADLESPRTFTASASTDGGTWAVDPLDADFVITSKRDHVTPTPPDGVVIVVDASGSTAPAKGATRVVLDGIPDGARVAVVAASDEVVAVTDGFVALDDSVRDRVDATLDTLPWAGGVDALPALTAALELAEGGADTRILFLHGAQLWVDEDETYPDLRSIHAAPVVPGPQRMLFAVPRESAPVWINIPPEHVEAGLRDAVAAWFDASPRPVQRFERTLIGSPPTEGPESSLPHALASLWARDHVETLRATDPVTATLVATRRRIVTPLSAALVLETDDEYDEHGLNDGAPSIPEPEEWALIGMVVLALGIAYLRRRRQQVALA